MAYITKEEVAKKRNAIKKAFPSKDGWKFSIRNEHHSSIVIDLMQYPKEYDFGEYYSVNHFYFENYVRDGDWSDKEKKVFETISEIAHNGHWDDSDIMTDYFNCAYYVRLGVGKWDKPALAI